MKRILRSLAAMLAAAALLCCAVPALAAETPAVSVQVDGEALVFPDAVPQLKDGRTYVPFRAVFEALDAQVDYDNGLVTAVRGGKAVSMTIGSTQATLTQSGETTTIAMDAAPYLDAATGRTYIPVRFAAQALGCAVGWDGARRTAVIVDVDKLVDEAFQGRSYTCMEQYLAYAGQFNEGIWDAQIAMTGSVTVSDEDVSAQPITIPVEVSAAGITSGQAQLEMDMTMKLDAASLIGQDQGDDPTSAMVLAMLGAMLEDGIGVQMRGDLSKGKLYLSMSGALLEMAGMSSDAWYSMDMDAMLQQSGTDMSFAQLLEQAGAGTDEDFVGTLKTSLAGAKPNNVDDYQMWKAGMDLLAAALADDAFQKDGDRWTAALKLPGDIPEETAALTLTLIMSGGKVAGYEMALSAQVDDGTNKVSLTMQQALDAQNNLTGELKMAVEELMEMDFALTGKYAKGTRAPALEPPAGATVTPIDELLPEMISTDKAP